MDFADSSFLISLAGNDSKTAVAVAHAATLVQPIAITDLNRLEFENALNLLRFRGGLDANEAGKALRRFEADEAGGRIRYRGCNWRVVFQRALRINRARTPAEGHRLVDLLHVAAALEGGATSFLSFDVRQRALAAAEGLSVGP
jgi:predicted nucleic acid-binding protein